MSDKNDLSFRNRLLRLWKGTALVIIVGLYVALLAVQLAVAGWVTALVVLGLILSATLFRYIGYAVNRVGVRMRMSGEASNTTLRIQRALIATLVVVVIAHDAGLVAAVYFANIMPFDAFVVAAWLIVVEILFESVRRTSVRVGFETALYGFPDEAPFGVDSQAARGARERSSSAVERKLATLAELLSRGEISEKAFRKTKDRLLIQRVLDDVD